MRFALAAAACVTPLRRLESPLLLVEDGLIAGVGRREEIELPAGTPITDCAADLPGAILAPGLIDIHLHGGAGHDVMSADAAGMEALERLLARHGVTSYLPTTITAPVPETLAALARLAQIIEASGDGGAARAQPLGINLEGPFVSAEKRGVHPLAYLQLPSLALFEKFREAARGHIRIMTVAPELPGALELITAAAQKGICVSLGHSNARYEEARAGIAAGARLATHTFNTMRRLDHRDPGIVAAVLNEPRVCAEVIADGVHVAPPILQLLLRAKGCRGVILVSDAVSATGSGNGRYALGPLQVEVEGDVCLSEGKLAGSVLTLDRAVRQIMAFAGLGLQDAIALAASNPAMLLEEAPHRGFLTPGARADIAVLSAGGEVMRTMAGGAWC
jgi:N-acetylglucosamine-6-phosphate deacetylase